VLRLVVPKGSLERATLQLFEDADLAIVRSSDVDYRAAIDDPRVREVMVLRPQEIPRYVADGLFDLGVTPRDWIEETGANVTTLTELHYSKATARPTRIVLAVAGDSPWQSVKDLPEGARVHTEYPELTRRFLEKHGVQAEITLSYGATEAKIPEIADAVVDLTESGRALRRAGGSFNPDVFTSQPRLGSAVEHGVGISYILQGTNDQSGAKHLGKLLMRLGNLRLARKLPSYVKNKFRLRDEQPERGQHGITEYLADGPDKESPMMNLLQRQLRLIVASVVLLGASVAHGEIQIIAVGTPPSEDGSADMQHVIAAARSVGRLMEGYKVVVTKSTVPVGTADKVKHAIIEEHKKRGRGNDFSVVSNPEFLKEGAAVEDFMRPDRIVIGSEDPRAIAADQGELEVPIAVEVAVIVIDPALVVDELRRNLGWDGHAAGQEHAHQQGEESGVHGM
jgi:ATP phosphoribosyltransferase